MDRLAGMIAPWSFLGCFAADRLHNSCRLQQCEGTKDEWVSATSSSACVDKPGDRTAEPGIRSLFAELRSVWTGNSSMSRTQPCGKSRRTAAEHQRV